MINYNDENYLIFFYDNVRLENGDYLKMVLLNKNNGEFSQAKNKKVKLYDGATDENIKAAYDNGTNIEDKYNYKFVINEEEGWASFKNRLYLAQFNEPNSQYWCRIIMMLKILK